MAQGGTGDIKALLNPYRFEEIVLRARELLHEFDTEPDCNSACYECLLSFYNQREHELLDRNLVLSGLRGLESVEIEQVVDMVSEGKMQELLSGCDSGFERKVLKELNDRGIMLPDSGQKIIYDGDVPVAKPDFFYERLNIVLFVDGPLHDKDYVQNDDEIKRGRLKEMGYRVFSVRYDQFVGDVEMIGKVLG